MTDPEDITNWRRLDERVTTSGQPTEAQLSALAALGVGHVINLGLHTHEKALQDEAGALAALRIGYTHIPVDFAAPTEEHLQRFVEALEELGDDAIVHVHCIANWRVSAFFYRYRRDRLGWDEAAARADMLAIWTPEGVWADFVDHAG